MGIGASTRRPRTDVCEAGKGKGSVAPVNSNDLVTELSPGQVQSVDHDHAAADAANERLKEKKRFEREKNTDESSDGDGGRRRHGRQQRGSMTDRTHHRGGDRDRDRYQELSGKRSHAAPKWHKPSNAVTAAALAAGVEFEEEVETIDLATTTGGGIPRSLDLTAAMVHARAEAEGSFAVHAKTAREMRHRDRSQDRERKPRTRQHHQRSPSDMTFAASMTSSARKRGNKSGLTVQVAPAPTPLDPSPSSATPTKGRSHSNASSTSPLSSNPWSRGPTALFQRDFNVESRNAELFVQLAREQTMAFQQQQQQQQQAHRRNASATSVMSGASSVRGKKSTIVISGSSPRTAAKGSSMLSTEDEADKDEEEEEEEEDGNDEEEDEFEQ